MEPQQNVNDERSDGYTKARGDSPVAAFAPDGTPLTQIRRSPHIDRSLDNTALNDYMSCPRKYFYGMVLHRRREGQTKPALTFGSAIHKGLEYWYRTGDMAQAQRALIMSWQPHNAPDDHRTPERALAVLEQYVAHYGGDLATETRAWGETVGWPENPLVEIPIELGWPGALHPYTGRIDRIIRWQGLYYVEDHKTTSQMGPYYFHQFDPSNQMMGYAVLAQEMTGLPIAGVRINAIAALKTQTKFARQIIGFAPERLVEWKENYNQWVQRVEESYELMHEGEQVGVPDHEVVMASWPHNFNACAGKYGTCQYAPVCTVSARLRHKVLEAEYEYIPWDPMAAAEEGTVE